MSGEKNSTEVAVFGGGCFWCTEAVFGELRGIISVTPGYAGGSTASPQTPPTYEEVSTGKTGHAEVVRVKYNPAIISYNDLLAVFFATHDPTTPNRQGADVGAQYRSIILYTDRRQKKDAEVFIEKLNKVGLKPVTEVAPLGNFYEAEERHKEYYRRNKSAPYCQIVINPKLEKLRNKFKSFIVVVDGDRNLL